MSEPYYLGMWVHVINVHWGGRFLTRQEYMNGTVAAPAHFSNTTPQQFIEGNCAIDAYGIDYVSILGLVHTRVNLPGYWDDDHNNGFVSGANHPSGGLVWRVPWPYMAVNVPYNGHMYTRVAPYDTDEQGNAAGWADPTKALRLNYYVQTFDGDIFYGVHSVTKDGAGTYTGIPLYLVRTGTGLIASNTNSANDTPIVLSLMPSRSFYIAEDAVHEELNDSVVTTNIYNYPDYSNGEVTVADIFTERAITCSSPLYVMDEEQKEVMLAYNGSGKNDCKLRTPHYAPVFRIGSMQMSFAGQLCVQQPYNANPNDVVITTVIIKPNGIAA